MEIFHVESVLETHLFWGQKVKDLGHEAKKHCRHWFFYSCECYLFLVRSMYSSIAAVPVVPYYLFCVYLLCWHQRAGVKCATPLSLGVQL